MKVFTYITAVAALVFGINTTHASTIEKSNLVVEAVGGAVSAHMDRMGESITLEMKTDRMQRALIQLRGARGEVFYENIVIVDSEGLSLDIDMTQFAKGIYTLTVKANDLKYQGRFKNK